MDRAAWLEARRKGIGGSDAAAIFGLSKYRSAVDVWADKVGISEEQPANDPMLWGQRLEDPIAAEYARQTGLRVTKPGGRGIRRARHVRTFPMIGSIDRFAHDADGAVRLVEIKTRRSDRDLGTDDDPPERRVPADWYLQGQHYAEVTQIDWIDFAVLVGGSDFRVIGMPRDPAFGADLVAEEGDFWNRYVVPKVQPPAGPDDLAFLGRKYPRDAGEERVATAEQELIIEAYLETQEQIARFETIRDGYRARLEEAMGDAARLLAGAAVVSWKGHDRTTVGWKAYAEALEQIIERQTPGEDLASLRLGYSETKPMRPFRVERKEGER